MSWAIPASLEAIFADADTTTAGFDELAHSAKQFNAVPDTQRFTPDERRGIFAELSAWRFMPSENGDSGPWGIYWGPLASGTLATGTSNFHEPDIANVDDDVLQIWIQRANTAKHAVLKARYADLAWDIGSFLKRTSKGAPVQRAAITIEIPVVLAHAAIEAYLDAVRQNLVEDEYHAWRALDRALALSIALSDKTRISRGKSALFDYFRSLAGKADPYMWWKLDELTADRRAVLDLGEVDQRTIIASLEASLARHSNIEDPQRFDPHAAMDAADRLTRHYRNDPEQLRRVIQQAGMAFECVAKKASGMLAVSWLEDLLPRYQSAKLFNDAGRVERTIYERADQARGELTAMSVPVEWPKDETERWIAQVVGDQPQEVFGRIGMHCLLHEKSTAQSVQDTLKNHALLSSMTVTAMGSDGFTQATINSLDDDLQGRAIQHAANRFNWMAPILHLIFQRAREKHPFDLDTLMAYVLACPFFSKAREALLREGLEAWFKEDAVKAIHVLVPQVEAACRDILSAIGAPVRVYKAHSGGFEVIGMGKVIAHPAFRRGVSKDIQFHLRALYCDPRGLNLRNHLAHGLAHEGLMGIGLANWVLHSILLLSNLRLKEGSPPI